MINEMMKHSLMNQTDITDMNDGKNRCEILGICYVPMQKWEQIYDEDTAYSVGTLFQGLNLPFLGGGK
jgi:hypothetical protein